MRLCSVKGLGFFKALIGNRVIMLLTIYELLNPLQEFGVVRHETLQEEGKVKVTKYLFTPSLYALVQRSQINMSSYSNIVSSSRSPFCK